MTGERTKADNKGKAYNNIEANEDVLHPVLEQVFIRLLNIFFRPLFKFGVQYTQMSLCL